MPIKNYYVASDGMGNVTAILDEDGNIVERRSYDAFGEMDCMTPDGTPVNISPTEVDVGFQGQIHDETTGLYQMGYRWYDPSLGRWLSRDPIGIAGGVNLYGAYRNNPMSQLDPWGEDSFDHFSDFFAGWGDTLTTIPFTSFSLTRTLRETNPKVYGASGGVNKSSNSYNAGEWTGVANSCAFACKGLGNLSFRLQKMPVRTRLYELGQKTLISSEYEAYSHISDPVKRGIAMARNGDASSLSLKGILTQSWKTAPQGLTPEAAKALPDILSVLYGGSLGATVTPKKLGKNEPR